MKWLWIKFWLFALAFLGYSIGFFMSDKPAWVNYLAGAALSLWLVLDTQKDMDAETRKLEFMVAMKRDRGRINVLSNDRQETR